MQPFVTLGDLIADFYVGVEHFPIQPGEHQDAPDLTLGPGGSGNALVAAARLGLPCVALGGMGDDWVGRHIRGQLAAEGVNVTHATPMPGERMAVAVVIRAQDGQHVFLGHYGTRGPRTLPESYAPLLRTAGVVLVDGWTYRHDWPEAILAGARLAAEAGALVMFDPGPQLREIDPAWLAAMAACARVLLLNEAEAEALAAVGLPPGPAEQVVIIKRGAAGCTIRTPAHTYACPGFVAPVVDLTAAGDCFAAAVAWGHLHGWPWEAIGRLANAVGAAKVQKIGTALAAPTRAEVEAVLAGGRGLEDW